MTAFTSILVACLLLLAGSPLGGARGAEHWNPAGPAGHEMADVVDTRAIGKCDNFQGDDSSWSGWRFRFEAWIGLLRFEGVRDVHGVLDHAARAQDVVDNDVLSEQAADMSRKVFAILVQLLRGRAP